MLVGTQQDFGVAASQKNFLLLIHFFLVSCLSMTLEDRAQQGLRPRSCLAMSVLLL